MKVDLKKYLERRDEERKSLKGSGPVITISREHGCDAIPLAQKIIWRISKHSRPKQWKYIDKEILETAAKELKVSTTKIEDVMDAKPGNAVEDLFSSFTQHYGVTSKKILKTIEEVLLSYASEGRVVIVGRGGAIKCASIPNSLHIRLEAPFNWRVNHLREKYGMTLNEAKSECKEIDEKRMHWNDQLSKKGHNNSVYDIILNKQSLSEDEILDVIFCLLESKKII